MTQNDALSLLGIIDISNAVNAIEEDIFDLKQEILRFSHVPQLIVSRQKKMNQISSICKTLNVHFDQKFLEFEIDTIDSELILDSFNLYHKNRAQISREILSSNNLDFIIYCSELMLRNLKTWAKKWPKLESTSIEEMKLSKELESVEMYRFIKNLNENNLFNFNELNSVNTPKELIIEIQRLNQIATFLD